MGWEDRPYYRDRSYGSTNPLMWLLTGSVSCGVWFGINVRVHAALLVFIVLNLVFPGALGGFSMSAEFMAILFGIVLLHEFGHCYGSRIVGGNPTQILMHPLGGLASADPPRRPWPTFFTVLAGPLVNVVICLICAASMSALARDWHVVPWSIDGVIQYMLRTHTFPPGYRLLSAIYGVSYTILLFNLLPIFPLDGGQMLQSLLWVKLGYYRATLFATVTGMIGSGGFFVWGLLHGSLNIAILAGFGFYYCFVLYRELKANGQWGYQEEDSPNYAASLVSNDGGASRRKQAARAAKRAIKLEREAAAEQEHIDQILAKVSAHGMHSLTWLEKRALHKATEHQRQRDAEITKNRKKF